MISESYDEVPALIPPELVLDLEVPAVNSTDLWSDEGARAAQSTRRTKGIFATPTCAYCAADSMSKEDGLNVYVRVADDVFGCDVV